MFANYSTSRKGGVFFDNRKPQPFAGTAPPWSEPVSGHSVARPIVNVRDYRVLPADWCESICVAASRSSIEHGALTSSRWDLFVHVYREQQSENGELP